MVLRADLRSLGMNDIYQFYEEMIECYHDEQAQHGRMMWRMLSEEQQEMFIRYANEQMFSSDEDHYQIREVRNFFNQEVS